MANSARIPSPDQNLQTAAILTTGHTAALFVGQNKIIGIIATGTIQLALGGSSVSATSGSIVIPASAALFLLDTGPINEYLSIYNPNATTITYSVISMRNT